jgi:hypothetical protein
MSTIDITKFKPMLGCNDSLVLDDLNYPLAASIKYEGIRCETLDGLSLSRELKPIRNKEIQKILQPLKNVSIKYSAVIECEIYFHGLNISETTMIVNSETTNSSDFIKRARKAFEEGRTKHQPHELKQFAKNVKFMLFDYIQDPHSSYIERRFSLEVIMKELVRHKYFDIVEQKIVRNKQNVVDFYEEAISLGYEGLVLRDMYAPYKYGRSTLNEHGFLKLKPVEQLETVVLDITERMINTNESFTNGLGYAKKRNTKENKQSTGIAATIIGRYDDKPIKITLTGDEKFRRNIWDNKDDYIGKTVLYKGILYSSSNVPRMPVFIKFKN